MTPPPRHSARRAGKRSRKLVVEQVVDPAKMNNSACPACDKANASSPHVVNGYYLRDGACVGVIACDVHREHIFGILARAEGHDGDPRGHIPKEERAELNRMIRERERE